MSEQDQKIGSTMHPATALLLARLESNPEEFWDDEDNGRRWNRILMDMQESAPEEYDAVVRPKVQAARMDGIHQRIMRELLRGPNTTEIHDLTARRSQILAPKKMYEEINKQLEMELKILKPGMVIDRES
jgi:hypothetical protein